MSKWKLAPGMVPDDSKENNVKPTWFNSSSPVGKISATGDQEYINLWSEHYSDFSGKILEIGAGNGFLAKNILQLNKNVDYAILDLEAHFDLIKQNVGDNVRFFKSSEYKKVFDEEWDMIIETHCLSETPQNYYTDIFENLRVKNCYVIDYGGDPNDPNFQETLDSWFNNTFKVKHQFNNKKLIGTLPDGIPVYIGKQSDD